MSEHSKGRWALGGLTVAILVVLGVSLSRGNQDGPEVEVEKVGRRTVVSRVKASGNISPRRKVEIQSKVIGEIVALPAREGEVVKAGEVVVEIEKKLYQAACDQAQAALKQAEVQLERAQAELHVAELQLQRTRHLHEEGVVSDDALERAQLAYEQAEVAFRAQQRAIEQARFAYRRALEDLDRTTIRSPMDGVVISRRAEVGETAIMGTTNFPGSVLMVIGDLSELVAEVEVPERDVVRLQVGQPATVYVDALPREPLPGRVVEIGSSGNKTVDVVKFKVKVALNQPDPRIKPEMTAKVEIVTQEAKQVLAVPQQAMQTRFLDEKGRELAGRSGGREVQVVYLFQKGRAVRREVTPGIQDELYVEIVQGLSEGDEVITGPYKTLRSLADGEKVRLRKEKRQEG